METIQMLNQNAADNGEDVVYTVNHLADVDPSEILMPERPWLGENHVWRAPSTLGCVDDHLGRCHAQHDQV
jgi:hypothetical protein